MGNYLQVTDLKKYFPEARIIDLADGDNTTETLATLESATEATLAAAIEAAESEADSYLQGRFTLPISPAPDRLKLAVGKIAVYYLFENKIELWGSGGNPQSDQYDIHREWLEGVKETDMYVGSTAVTSSTDVLSTVDDGEGAGLVFGNGGLDDY